jgi:hypothetical protein
MLVSTMTKSEIDLEVNLDYAEIIQSNVLYLFRKEYFLNRKSKGISAKKDYPIFKEITSKRKNHWYLLAKKQDQILKYQDEEDTSIRLFMYSFTERGFRVYLATDAGNTLIYNGHLFDRYNERMGLGMTDLREIAKEYFIHNSIVHHQMMPDRDEQGTIKAVGISKDGFSLGILQFRPFWTVHKTFLKHGDANNFSNLAIQDLIENLAKRIATNSKSTSPDEIENQIELFNTMQLNLNEDFDRQVQGFKDKLAKDPNVDLGIQPRYVIVK